MCSLHASVFSTHLEMRKTNTPTTGLKDCIFLYVWTKVCTDLFSSYAEKLGHTCSEEWSVNPVEAAHISMSNSFNFALPRQKLFPEKSSESDHLLLLLTVVSRSRTLKDRLWPLSMGLPGIQYSTFYKRTVTKGFSFFLCLFHHDIFTSFLYVILFLSVQSLRKS